MKKRLCFILLLLVCVAVKAQDASFSTDGKKVCPKVALVLGGGGGVGVIFLAWGLLDVGAACAAHETRQQSQAIKKVIGGLIMIAVPAILKLLGVS